MAIVLVMGAPGAGKTFLCTHLIEHLSQPCQLFSFDDMYNDDHLMNHFWNQLDQQPSLLGLYGVHNERTAHSERKRCEAKVRRFLVTHCSGVEMSRCCGTKTVLYSAIGTLQSNETELSQSSKSENSQHDSRRIPLVIVDDIFYLSSMRRPFERMARALHLAYVVIFVDTPLERILLQNRSRPSHLRIPERTVRNVFERMELPRLNESLIKYSGKENIATLAMKIETIAGRYASARTDKAEVYDESGRNCKEEYDNCWEKLDIELRKAVSELMQLHKNSTIARCLITAKKQLANELRTNDIRDWDRERLKEMLLKRTQDCGDGVNK